MRVAHFLAMVLGLVLLWTLTGPAHGKTTLTVWSKLSGDELTFDKKMVEEFKRTHPDIDVEYVSVTSDYYNKLSVAVAGDAAPDVAQLIATFSLAEFAEAGLIQPIDKRMEAAGVNPEDFFPAVYDSWRYNGHTWAMTYDVDVNMLFWNKAIFSRNGLDPNSGPEMIDDLDTSARRLTKIDSSGKITRMGLVPWSGDWLTWAPAWGAQLWDPDTKKVTANSSHFVKMFEWMASYAERYGPSRVQAFMDQIENYYRGDPIFNELLAMEVNGPWMIGFSKLYAPDVDWGMGSLPYPAFGNKNASTGNALTLLIPTGAKHPREAFEYIRWRTSLEHVLKRQAITPTPTVPVRIAAAKAFVQDNPVYLPIINILAGPNLAPYLPTMPVSVYYSGQMWEARNRVVNLEATPQAALDDVTTKVQARLDEVLNK